MGKTNGNSLLSKSKSLLVTSCIALGFTTAQAATVYSYTGNQFNDFRNGGTCPPVCQVTGSFTVAQPLAPNLPELTSITPLSYSISSGGLTVTDTNADTANSQLFLGTNAAGQITSWSWLGFGPVGSATEARIVTQNVSDPAFVFDDVHIGTQGPPNAGPLLGIILGAPGTWTTTTAVPEPGTILLAGISVAIFASLRRRRPS